MESLCANWTAVNGSNFSLDCMDMFHHHVEHSEFNVMKNPMYAGFVITLYTIVILFGGLGNTLVVLTIAKTKPLWNATNIFIANLAMADILVCVFDLPFNAYYAITEDWVFGKAMCHVIQPAFAVTVYASSWSLTMIAIDRYLLIVHPLKLRMSNKIALLLVLAIAVLSLAVASPIAYYAQYTEYIDPSIGIFWRLCGEQWPDEGHQRQLYTILTLALQYCVPLIIIAILYTFIFRRVRERMRNVRQGQNCRKTKTTKMLVAVVTIFAITWTPYHLFSLISEFRSSLVTGPYYKFADSILRVVAMSSSCINPLLYGWLNDNYRIAFLNIVRSSASGGRRVRRDSDVMQSTTKKTTVSLPTSTDSPSLVRLNGTNRSAARSNPQADTEHQPEETVPLKAVSTDDMSDKSGTQADTEDVTVAPSYNNSEVNANGKASSQMALLNT